MLDWKIVYEYFDTLNIPDGWLMTRRQANMCLWENPEGDLSVTAILSQPYPDPTWLTLMIERRDGTPTMDDVTFVVKNWGWPGRRWVLEFSPGWMEDIPPKIIQLSCTIGEDILRRWL
jgi:hypothetical protein